MISRCYKLLSSPVTTLGLFLLILSGCQKLWNSPEIQVIATVNQEPVPLEDFLISFEQLKNQQDEISQRNPKIKDHLKVRALNEVVIEYLLKQEAAKNQIQVAKEEIEARLASFREGYPVGGFEEMLRKRNTTKEYLKRRIESLLLIEKLSAQLFASESLVSDEELQKYYQQKPNDFQSPTKVHAFQIVVPTVEEAQKIRNEILSNKTTFESAARQYSLSPDASKGGDLGFFAQDEKIEAFNHAFKLSVGAISEPIRSPYGVHILKVVEKRLSKRLTFLEAKQEIVTKLSRSKEAKAYREWITNLLKEGKINRNETLFESIT